MYNVIMKGAETGKNRITVWILRAFFTLASILVLAFIFGNSAATGEESSSVSLKVTESTQDCFEVIAPESFIATAEGEDFDLLHSVIRKIAHFSEFALLGVCLTLCYLSYSREKVGLLIPVFGVAFVPMLDEYLQSFSSGRAAELFDVAIDTAGGLCGVLVALALAAILFKIIKKRKNRVKNAA